ncbi:MAG: hypothetical protein ABIS18_03190 [Actinomycetota bacterium]
MIPIVLAIDLPRPCCRSGPSSDASLAVPVTSVEGLGLGVGDLLGVGLGDTDGLGEGEAVGDALREGDGDGDGDGATEGGGDGAAAGSTLMTPCIDGWILQE